MFRTLLNGQFGLVFVVHFILVVLTWVGPFLAWWPLPVGAYCIILLQYILLNKCVMNRHHQLSEAGGQTFYGHLFDLAGISHDKAKLRFFIRKIMMPMLIVFTILLQEVFGFVPLWSR